MITSSTRRVLLAGGAALVVTVLAGCAGTAGGDSAGEDGDFRVSFSNFTESAPLFHVIHTTLDDQLAEVSTGVQVKWYDNAGDPAKMLQNTQLMVADAPDALVIYPVTTATEGIAQLVTDSGLPCVAINLDVSSCDFLNIDTAALGTETASIVADAAIAKGWDASNTTILLGQNAAAGDGVNNNVRGSVAKIGGSQR